jgi:hypothetical protein
MRGGFLYREDAFRDYDHAAKRAEGIGFTIDYNGLWYHHDGARPGPVRRVELAALFGGAGTGFMAGRGLILEHDGTYWLAGPETRYRVAVEDVPFIATRLDTPAPGIIDLYTNFDEKIEIGPDHALFMRAEPLRGDMVLYAEVRGGMLARCSRAVHAALVTDHAHEMADGSFTVKSRGIPFAI